MKFNGDEQISSTNLFSKLYETPSERQKHLQVGSHVNLALTVKYKKISTGNSLERAVFNPPNSLVQGCKGPLAAYD